MNRCKYFHIGFQDPKPIQIALFNLPHQLFDIEFIIWTRMNWIYPHFILFGISVFVTPQRPTYFEQIILI